MSLTDRVALVTGAGNENGIGFASARKMALQGANLVITDVADNKENLKRIAGRLAQEAGVTVLPMICDVTDDESMKTCVDGVLAEFGAVDILFNNAGIGTLLSFEESTMAYFDLVYRVNVRGAIMLCKLVLPVMQKQQRGVIINNASMAGVYGTHNQTHYSSSKHAVVGFTKSLASEVGRHNIRVLAVCPGLIKTQMWTDGLKAIGIPEEKHDEIFSKHAETVSLERWGTADEVGDFVAYAASDQASYLSGSYYLVHGGAPIDGLV